METKGLFIKDLPDCGEITFLTVVMSKELRPKRKDGVFLSFLLADRTGEVDAKVWDEPEAAGKLFECCEVVKIRGAVEQYNGRSQLIVGQLRCCEAHEYDAGDFYASSKRDPGVAGTAAELPRKHGYLLLTPCVHPHRAYTANPISPAHCSSALLVSMTVANW